MCGKLPFWLNEYHCPLHTPGVFERLLTMKRNWNTARPDEDTAGAA